MAQSRSGIGIAAIAVPLAFVAVATVATVSAAPLDRPAASSASQTPQPSPSPSESATKGKGGKGGASKPAKSSAADPQPAGSASDPAEPTGEPSASGSAPNDYSPKAPTSSGGPVKVISQIDTKDPVFFITIDDGITRDEGALRYVQDNQIPVTAFLTQWTVPGHIDYFEKFTAYGGSVQNHTMRHGSFTDPTTDIRYEICKTQDIFEKDFGYRPWMLRPPYGNGPDSPEVQSIAQECGINRIIMWNVVVYEDGTTVDFWDPPLSPGDIVIFHFTENLETGLRTIMAMAEKQGLRPASLQDYI